MSIKLNPYLNFAGNAREALEFYHGIFGGEITLSTFGEFPNPDLPKEYEDKIMHGVVESADVTIMASEGRPGVPPKVGDNVNLSLSGDDDAKLTGYFDALCVGGEVSAPLAPQVWGDKFGMVTDKFGINWLVNITKAQ